MADSATRPSARLTLIVGAQARNSIIDVPGHRRLALVLLPLAVGASAAEERVEGPNAALLSTWL
jgi:hypothetical protein